LFRVIDLVNACDGYVFPTIELISGVNDEVSETIEALTLDLFGELIGYSFIKIQFQLKIWMAAN
jgi:hypothetical protein